MKLFLTLVFLSFVSSAAADEAPMRPERDETVQPAAAEAETDTLAEQSPDAPFDYDATADEATPAPTGDAAAQVPPDSATSLQADGSIAAGATADEATDSELSTGIPVAPTTPKAGANRAKALLRPMPESLSNDDPNGSVFNRELSPDRYKNSLPSIEKEMPGGSKVILLPGH